MDLPRISQKKLKELQAMGIMEISEIPESFLLTSLQERVRNCVVRDAEYISPEVKGLLRKVVHPVHFLDFETVNPAIPIYAGTRPYQAIPFQWSDHILHTGGRAEHREYICQEAQDPREEFLETLLETLGEKGTVFAFSGYEKRMIEAMARCLPEREGRLKRLLPRLIDLQGIIREHYYHPAFHGSFSLKSILPALLPEMSYANLAIQEGQSASLEYTRMIDPATPYEEKERIRKDLLAYCGYDTFAMLKIREELLNRTRS
jgi:hypothetical protein